MSRKKYLILFFIVVSCWALFSGELKLFESYNHTLAGQKIVRIHPTATPRISRTITLVSQSLEEFQVITIQISIRPISISLF